MLFLDVFWSYFSFILRYLFDYFVIGSKKIKKNLGSMSGGSVHVI